MWTSECLKWHILQTFISCVLFQGSSKKNYADSSSFNKFLTVSKKGKNSLFYLVNYISIKSNIATKVKINGNHWEISAVSIWAAKIRNEPITTSRSAGTTSRERHSSLNISVHHLTIRKRLGKYWVYVGLQGGKKVLTKNKKKHKGWSHILPENISIDFLEQFKYQRFVRFPIITFLLKSPVCGWLMIYTLPSLCWQLSL